MTKEEPGASSGFVLCSQGVTGSGGTPEEEERWGKKENKAPRGFKNDVNTCTNAF